MNNSYSNHLIHETSPYLLQHAHNPVDWYPWSDEALQKAKTENKPILISIGYAACHWCHVMEKESFEDEETALLMNKYFVNIKVDREERPDLDHIYMDAVQAISGSGGWPLNVFLTPEGKPFYGGTYFPPVRAFNRASWKEVLEEINEAYTKGKNEIESQAENLIQHLISANTFGTTKHSEQSSLFTKENLISINENILKNADKIWGGFGNAPKFPQTFLIQFLLRHYYFTKNDFSLQHALLSLDKMLQGGIYDQVGGGFARYSTDKEWFAPHFEKMLYDNALLLVVLGEAFQITKKEIYSKAIYQAIEFIEREMLSPGGGFYSALDADSEGVEGKFYTWNKKEIDEMLGQDSDIFCKVYNVFANGNWEHTNILWLPKSIDEIAAETGIDIHLLQKKLDACKHKLLANRISRIRPLLDDKILLGWNAMMIFACCKIYAASGEIKFLKLAENNILFLEKNLRDDSGNWQHTWKNGKAKYAAFLDDYSFLIEAYIQLQEVTGNTNYLVNAKKITELIIENFGEEETGYFFFTPLSQKDIIVRKKELYDGATPSGNAVMANNLFYLSVVFNFPEWRARAEKMLRSLMPVIIKYPTSFGEWAKLLQIIIYGTNEIAITGADALQRMQEINQYFIPDKIIQASTTVNNEFPLLKNKESSAGKTQIFLCRQYACKNPVENVHDLLELLYKD